MRSRIATPTGLLVGLALLAAACGGTVAGRDRGAPADAAADPTTTASLGSFLPSSTTPVTIDERATTTRVPRTTVPRTTVVPTDPPVVTEPPDTTTAPTTVAITTPRDPDDPPPVPTYPPYTVRPGLTGEAALTGRPAPADVAARPVLAVKIDNVGSARPQWALDRADVVFEENVEGATRFLALFHSDVPAEVGPVRSARTTDIDLLAAMNRPVLGWSGGNPGVTAWIRAAADAGLLVDIAAVRSNCYRRESSRRAPHNLLATTTCLLERGATAGAARPLWEIDADWLPTTAATADRSFEVAMDNLRAGWTWDAASTQYLRSQNGAPHVVASGTQIGAANVVVIFATHVPSVVDARSPEAVTVGSGTAVVHRDGMAIPARWSRASASDRFELAEVNGSPLPLQVGRTFVELARAG